MKKLIYLLICIPLLFSCEDVVEVDLEAEAPRLIVDALIRVDTTQSLTPANIKISLSSSFFDEIQPAEVESLIILNESSGAFVPYEPVPGEPGMYRPFPTTVSPVADNMIVTSFLSDPDAEFIMQVDYEGRSYLARTNFAPSVAIDDLTQGDGMLFGDDQTEVAVTFTDFPQRQDFYVFDLDFGEFITSEDQFIEGQEFQFSYFYDQNIEPGDEITISILGATEQFFDYMNGIIEQSQQGDNGPFQTPTATVRGNFLNVTDIDNIDQFDNLNRPDAFILGYFSVSQVFTERIVIEDL
ncbi:DUF4249 family protein [Dokdonia sinensis]|uniref:DUF4249 family protein n=1 Tax=Dokdonia sinensis TaxID=2479847 RepID=A0A3M0GHB8_9FLAO|nr:DUF4249 family protein [Dokdonia sinensis]RMB64060.1 DUF4249 family protein [Dokdonia sinensis]